MQDERGYLIGAGRRRRWAWAVLAACLLLTAAAPPAQAIYRDLVGYPILFDYLGNDLPDGSGIAVAQVEAQELDGDYLVWPGSAQFAGKSIVDMSGITSGNSDHALQVALNFFGLQISIAPGISDIEVWEAIDWQQDGFLDPSGGGNPPPPTTSVRIVNHSYIASATGNSDALVRFDYTVNADDMIHVAGLPNIINGDFPLWKTAYNGITVGRTDTAHIPGTFAIDSVYGSGRNVPTVVTPGFLSSDGTRATSFATPMVSAGAALLLETGQDASLSNGAYTNRTRTINHAEASEVVKALIMAGADRHYLGPRDSTSTDDLLDYAVTTDNNLDSTYGAGSFNIYHSHRILTTGEHDSTQDGEATDGGYYGWDYDPSFGGVNGSNATASYFLEAPSVDAKLVASLVWNLDVVDPNGGSFNPTTLLVDMDLALYNDDTAALVDSSTSTDENTENLFVNVEAGTRYELRVTQSQFTFDHDYAIAWRFQPQNQWELGHADGDWSDSTFWTTGVPNGNTDDAAFHATIKDPHTVNLDQSVTVRSLWFDSVHPFTISPAAAQTITLDTDAGDARIYLTNFHGDVDQLIEANLALADNLVVEHLSAGELATTGGLNNSAGHAITKIGSGTWRIDGAQSHGVGASLAINGGHVQLDSDAGAGGANLVVTLDGGSVEFKADQSLAALTVTNGSVEFGSSPGTIEIEGDLELETGSAIAFDIAGGGGVGGTDFDQVNASAGASLGGALELREDGYTPALGDEFVIITSDGLTGHFDNSAVTGASLTANTSLAVLYEDAGNDADFDLDLVRVMATYNGDTNGDGSVSLLDLNTLGASFGLTDATWQMGDFNYDGVVSLVDLNALGATFGSAIIAPEADAVFAPLAAFAVPEPAGALLMLTGLPLLLGRRR